MRQVSCRSRAHAQPHRSSSLACRIQLPIYFLDVDRSIASFAFSLTDPFKEVCAGDACVDSAVNGSASTRPTSDAFIGFFVAWLPSLSLSPHPHANVCVCAAAPACSPDNKAAP